MASFKGLYNWIHSITNHFYWAVDSTDESARTERWLSVWELTKGSKNSLDKQSSEDEEESLTTALSEDNKLMSFREFLNTG